MLASGSDEDDASAFSSTDEADEPEDEPERRPAARRPVRDHVDDTDAPDLRDDDDMAGLYPHQRDGVRWMWALHRRRAPGGILADDMGLGKTVQVAVLLRLLFARGLARTALIVMPKVVLGNWAGELARWCPGARVGTFHGPSPAERERQLARVIEHGGVCLTTYGMVRNNAAALAAHDWSYAVLDEGHLIKNPSCHATRALKSIAAAHRLILTGTPVQNNLRELWTLLDYVTDGELLGTRRAFIANYERPILRAADRGATDADRRLGNRIGEELRAVFAPYFLRREKKTVFSQSLRKKELVVWTYLQPPQLEVYRAFLETPEVNKLFNSKQSPLAALVVLRKICDHPLLLNASDKTLRGLLSAVDASSSLAALARDSAKTLPRADTEQDDLDPAGPARGRPGALRNLRPMEVAELVAQSGKLMFLRYLLPELVRAGHRVLLFSQSLRMLDLLEMLLGSLGIAHARIDGSIVSQDERQRRIDAFQRPDGASCFLLTTEVGGVGLTLTGADRVVVVEPHWNPAKDAQAVDRACRMGQTRPVVVYRLNSCGTVEEKIFRKQVFKRYLSHAATEADGARSLRYFTREELRDLFSIPSPYVSRTHEQLVAIHGAGVALEGEFEDLGAHLYAICARPEVFAVSDHNLLYSKLEPPLPPAEGGEEQQQPRKGRGRPRKGHALADRDDMTADVPDVTRLRLVDDEARDAGAASGEDDVDSEVQSSPARTETPPQRPQQPPPEPTPSRARIVLPSSDEDADEDEDEDETAVDEDGPCATCAASLGPDAAGRFRGLLRAAEGAGDLAAALDALELCAHEPRVHAIAQSLGRARGWW